MKSKSRKAILSAAVAAICALSLVLSGGCTMEAEAKSAEGKTVIVLDPGHGGAELGAVKPPFAEGIMTLYLAQQIQAYLANYDNVEVCLTRTGDTELSLKDRVDYAKSVNADFFVCLHFNASGSIPNKYGSEVYVSIDPTLFPREAFFAQTELNELHALGLNVRGIKYRVGENGDYYGITRRATAYGMESALIEHCFLDSAPDRAFLGNGDSTAMLFSLQTLAFADADAIAKHLQLSSSITGVNYTGYVEPAITWPILPYTDD